MEEQASKRIGLVLIGIAAIASPFAIYATATEDARQAELQRQVEQEQQQAEAEAEAKINAETEARKNRQLSIYGMDEETFGEVCREMIAAESGSRDFGVFDTDFQEINGVLLLSQSVYGTNAFGTKVEQRYTCRKVGTQGIEFVFDGLQFHK